jgi:hypothetical protein
MADPNTISPPPVQQPYPQTPLAVAPTQLTQPVIAVPVPVPAPAPTPAEGRETHPQKQTGVPTLRIYGHSSLFYWWPVWVTGYAMALASYLGGEKIAIGDGTDLINPSSNLGVIFFLVLFFVIVVTSVSVRGLASAMVLLSGAFLVLLFSYFGLWDTIFDWLGHFRIHLNFAAYFWFSTLLFLVWAAAFFIFDRLTYWEIKPGQITENFFLGGGSRSFDTENMMVEKFRNDLFRHWIIGMGTGDLHIETTGATKFTIEIPNVLFIGRKVRILQEMIATIPDQFGHVTVQ